MGSFLKKVEDEKSLDTRAALEAKCEAGDRGIRSKLSLFVLFNSQNPALRYFM